MTGRKLGLILGSNARAHGALDLDDPKYIDETVAIPDEVDPPKAGADYPYGMDDNDTYGDCVAAAVYHMQEVFRLIFGIEPTPWSAETVLAWYFAVNGVPPGPPGSSSDQGTDPSAAMQYWQQDGLGGTGGHKLAGFGVLQPGSPNIRRAIFEFGAVMFAVALPTSAQQQGVNWRAVPGMVPGSWGGHAIAGNGYTAALLKFLTWGEQGDMDNPFWAGCGEQVLVPLTTAQIGPGGVGPGGYRFGQMATDLPALA